MMELDKRLTSMGSWLQQRLEAPADTSCGPLHGSQPTIQQQAALFTAFAAWQANNPIFIKDRVATVQKRSGGTYSYSFADLGQATELAHTASSHGLCTWQVQIQIGRHLVARAYLVHQEGGFIYADVPIFPKNSEGDRAGQDWAAGYTFARRYALCSVLGISPSDDDEDGEAPQQRPTGATRQPNPPPTRTTTTPQPLKRVQQPASVPSAGSSEPAAAGPAAPGYQTQPPFT